MWSEVGPLAHRSPHRSGRGRAQSRLRGGRSGGRLRSGRGSCGLEAGGAGGAGGEARHHDLRPPPCRIAPASLTRALTQSRGARVEGGRSP